MRLIPRQLRPRTRAGKVGMVAGGEDGGGDQSDEVERDQPGKDSTGDHPDLAGFGLRPKLLGEDYWQARHSS